MKDIKSYFNSSFLLVFCYLFTFLVFWLIKDYPFFWDTIQLGSKHAHFYYENDFRSFLLPQNIDSGHPPFFGLYLALLWKLFGQTLAVSHFAILPFTLLSIYVVNKIGDYFLGKKKGIWLILLILVDPTFAAQNILVSPDAILMSCFLLGILAIIKRRDWLLVLAALGLAMVSMRGMMVVLVLYVLKVYESWQVSDIFGGVRHLFKNGLVFIPSGLLALAFLGYHYYATGWIGYHENSPWATSFERVDFKGFLKNIGILGWRLVDFGRVFVMLPLIVLLSLKFTRKINPLRNQKFTFLAVLLISSVILLTPSLLIHKYLTAHRYLLPVFFACSLFLLYLVFNHQTQGNKSIKNILLPIIFFGLFSGNFWIYPPKIAQGWDATLSHLPYYDLRAEMMDHIKEEQLDFQKIGSVFPEVGARKFRELNGIEEGFSQADLNNQDHIFYSNVMNDFSDEEVEELMTEWKVIKRLEKRGVFVVLCEKK
ncbi:MAG: glycosyltransferase family 39 protein [Bacteroidota bacterium]